MKISIIIPVYNGEKFLDNSIKRILSQPFENIELILVNDGSTDRSKDICEKYKAIDSRVHLINKKNGGICSARNIGISLATGEWISFIDQDDLVHPDIYINLTRNIDDKTDFVVAGKKMLLIDDNDSIISVVKYDYCDKIIENKNDIFNLLCNIENDGCTMHLWNCLYKRELIIRYSLLFNTKFRFGHEDTLFNAIYLTYCNKIAIHSGIVYSYYRRFKTSTSLKMNNDYLSDFKEYCKQIYRIIALNLPQYKQNDFLFSYFYRLGINLFVQYGKNVNDLYKIYVTSVGAYDKKVKKTFRSISRKKEILYRYIIYLTLNRRRIQLNVIFNILRSKR